MITEVRETFFPITILSPQPDIKLLLYLCMYCKFISDNYECNFSLDRTCPEIKKPRCYCEDLFYFTGKICRCTCSIQGYYFLQPDNKLLLYLCMYGKFVTNNYECNFSLDRTLTKIKKHRCYCEDLFYFTGKICRNTCSIQSYYFLQPDNKLLLYLCMYCKFITDNYECNFSFDRPRSKIKKPRYYWKDLFYFPSKIF
jgi:hypothetical protein